MHIYISVISHNNTNHILTLNCLPELAKLDFVTVVVKDNLSDEHLERYCNYYGLNYLASDEQKGFGANNNDVFAFCMSELGMSLNDGFMLLNPDVIITPESLCNLRYRAKETSLPFLTGALFIDSEYTIQDHSIRAFPKFRDILASFIFGRSRNTIEVSKLSDLAEVDCCSGALMFFRVEHFKRLNGFDERYYLYYEDFDICRRSKRSGVPLVFLADLKAIHYRQRESRKLFTWHFWQHVRSALIFSLDS